MLAIVTLSLEKNPALSDTNFQFYAQCPWLIYDILIQARNHQNPWVQVQRIHQFPFKLERRSLYTEVMEGKELLSAVIKDDSSALEWYWVNCKDNDLYSPFLLLWGLFTSIAWQFICPGIQMTNDGLGMLLWLLEIRSSSFLCFDFFYHKLQDETQKLGISWNFFLLPLYFVIICVRIKAKMQFCFKGNNPLLISIQRSIRNYATCSHPQDTHIYKKQPINHVEK